MDHVIPEALLKDPERLQGVLAEFGLPSGFDLNDFPNWLPAHLKCNQQKAGEPFRATPMIQRKLEVARREATKARRMATTAASRVQVERALLTLERAKTFSDLDAKELLPLLEGMVERLKREMRPNGSLGLMRRERLYLTPFAMFEIYGETAILKSIGS